MQQGLAERIETIQRKQNQEMADYMRHFRRKAMEVVESFPENPELNQKLEENFRRMEEFANELTGQAWKIKKMYSYLCSFWGSPVDSLVRAGFWAWGKSRLTAACHARQYHWSVCPQFESQFYWRHVRSETTSFLVFASDWTSAEYCAVRPNLDSVPEAKFIL